MKEVAQILLNYTDDKIVPMFGFGARTKFPEINSFDQALHIFPMNGNPNNPKVFNI